MMDERWNAVRQRYSRMEDEELRRVRKDVDGLEEWARDLLRSEMSSRGLSWDVAEEAAEEPALDPRFYSAGERARIIALGGTDLRVEQEDLDLARWVLRREGIESAIAPVSQYEGDVRVAPEDVDRALAVIAGISMRDRELYEEDLSTSTIADACPKCGSEEIMVESVDDDGSKWLCDACGHRWSDADLQPQEEE